jgi:uncharacterized protein YggE
MRIMLVLLGVFLVSGPVSVQAQELARHVSVDGVGRVSAVPDTAVIQLGVEREARDAGAAMTAASEAMTAVLAQITSAGIAPEDVQTTGIGLGPRWNQSDDGSPPRVTGYVASNSLNVRVRDLELLGGLLSAVVSDGANTMNAMSFQVAEPGALEDAARVAAVEDAARKARILAEAAGATLGNVVSISEGQPGGFPGPMMEVAMADRAAVPVAAGQIEIMVTVRAVYALGD